MTSEFGGLLLITILAVAVPILASRIRMVRLPIVVGEILAGILIGRSGLNIVHPSPALTFLAEFGFAFLMFLSGLEINFDLLFAAPRSEEKRPAWQKPVPLALISFIFTLVLASLIGVGLTALDLARSPILMGLILSTTSLGIVVPILKERGLTTTSYGQALLVAALISDFATLLLLSLSIAILSQGIRLELLLFMVLLAGFVAAAKLSQWLTDVPLLKRIVDELSHATAQIRVRGAFALMVVWVVMAEALGVEVILGAFLAGAILSAAKRSDEANLHEKLDAIGYGFFIPIFFITVGAEFDLGALLASPAALLLLPVLIVSAYLVKFIPALIFRTRYSWRESLAAGALLSSRLSLIIAASAIALEIGMISSATNSAVILVAIVSCTFSPLLFSRILPPEVVVKREGVVILGTGQLSILLSQRLRNTGESVCLIGENQEQLDRLQELGFPTMLGAPEDTEVLERAGLPHARALIAVTNASQAVVRVCCLAQEQYGVPIVIARADDPALVQELRSLGVRVVQPAMATALALEGALHFPTAFSILAEQSDDVELVDIPLTNNALVGTPLRKVRLPGNALVLGIQRQGEVVIPHGDTILLHEDVLLLVGSPDALAESVTILDGYYAQ